MKTFNIRKDILGASSALNVLAMVGAGVTVTGLAAAPVAAQDAALTEDEATVTDTGDRIIVTGSRIARPELDSTVPVTNFGGDDIYK